MGCITKSVGRLLFVMFLVSSAYLHISKPETFTTTFTTNWNQLSECVGKHLPGVLPSLENFNWNLWIQIFGAFEGLVALLILSGDWLGGVLLFLTLLGQGMFSFCQICSFMSWEVSRQLEFAKYLFFVGASLAFICSGSCKKSKSCGKQEKCSKEGSCEKSCKQSCKKGESKKGACKDSCKQVCNKEQCKKGACKGSCKGDCSKQQCQCK